MTTQSKTITLNNLQPGASYDVWVRGVTSDGKYSYWSNGYNLTVLPDAIPPSKPAVPTVSTSNSSNDNINTWTVLVSHSGFIHGTSNKLQADVVMLKVFVREGSSGSTTEIGELQIAQADGSTYSKIFTVNRTGTSTTQYSDPRFSVKAVDRSGNISEESDAVSPSTIAWFNQAYISDLSADKITTGTLKASQQISVGTSSPIVLKSNASSPFGQMYLGAGSYNNSNTDFYVDSTGKFSLGASLRFNGNDSLTFKGSSTSSVEVQINTSTGVMGSNLLGALNIIGGTNKLALDANDIQVSTNSSVDTLRLNRYGGGIQIGSSANNSNLDLFGSATISGTLISDGYIQSKNEFRAAVSAAADADVSYSFTSSDGTTDYNNTGMTSTNSNNLFLTVDGVTMLQMYNNSVTDDEIRIPVMVKNTYAYINPTSGRDLYVSSNGTFGYLASTRTVKSLIENYESEINSSNILDLDVVRFKYNFQIDELGDEAPYKVGFIAEDAEALGLDMLIQRNAEGNVDYFDYGSMSVYLFSIVKNQAKKIEELELRLAVLENK